MLNHFETVKRVGRRVAPALILFIAVYLFYWKLTLTTQYTWMDGPDTVNQVLPWLQFQALSWHRHILPLWDPRHWGGQALIGQNQPGAVYPLNWLLFLAPLKNVRLRPSALNFYFVFIHVIGALTGYHLCRVLKRSRTASLLGGLGFAVAGYVGTNNWPQMINGAVWSPLVIAFWIKALSGKRPYANAALAGGVLGFSLLSGHHQVPLFTALAVGGLTIVYLVSRLNRPGARTERWSILASYAAMGLLLLGFTVVISALQTVPSQEYWRDAYRWVNAKDPVTWNDKVPYFVHQTFSLSPVGIVGAVIPFFRPDGASSYVGITLFILSIFGALAYWKSIHVRAMACLGIGSLIYALGGMSVFQGVLYALVPTVDKARNPAMAIIIYDVAICALAAFGLDALRSRSAEMKKLARPLYLGLFGLAAAIYLFLMGDHVAQGDHAYAFRGEGFAAFSALIVAVILYCWTKGAILRRSAAILLLLMVLFDQGPVTGSDYPHQEAGWNNYNRLFAHDDIADFLRRQPGPFRISVEPNDIPYNFGDWHGLDQISGYNGVSTNVFNHYGSGSASALMGLKYYLAKAPRKPEEREVFSGASGIKVYQVPDALPRAWVVHQVSQVPPGAIDEKLNQPPATLLSQGFMSKQTPTLNACGGPDSANVIQSDGNRAIIQAELSCKGMLMVSNTYAPGWTVTIDGRPATLYETYGFIWGVPVDAGKHKVEFKYRPGSVYTGAFLTLAGLIALAIIARPRSGDRRRPRAAQPSPKAESISVGV